MSGMGLGNAVSSVTRVLVGVTAVVIATVTGCATKGVPYQTPSSAASSPSAPASAAGTAAPTESMTPVAAASGQLTGTQLQTVLLPQSSFPAGFTLSPSSAVSSGDALSSAPPQYDLATVDCATFINHFGNTGFGETAMASNSAVTQSQQAFDQVVYQFGSPGAASAFVSGIQSLAARCRSFTATDNGVKGTFSLRATPGPAVGGHPSLELAQSGVLNGSSLTLDTLLSASGVDVFAGAAVGLGAGAPTGLATETIVYNLMKRQAAAAVLGS
jgi:hypothetical protein